MNKILFIYQGHYPWDIRIEKFIETLSKDNEVHLLSRNLKKSSANEKLKENVYIHRLSLMIAGRNFLSTPFHLNFFWSIFINKYIKCLNPTVIIVRDLPLAKLVINKGRKYNIPVIFDNAENYPEFIKTFPKYKNFVFHFLWKLNFFYNLEKHCVSNAYKTINVIEENTQRLSKYVSIDKMVEIYNVPLLRNTSHEFIEVPDKKLDICYVGAVNDDNLRGVSDLVLCSKYIQIPHKIHIFGDGNEKDKLRLLAIENGVDKDIVFHGMVDYKELEKHLYIMDIGVVTHRTNTMTNTTMANKIYEYISYGMCVITTDAIPLKRFTEDNNIGLVYKSGDYRDLANKIMETTTNNLLSYDQRRVRENLYLSIYNWQVEEKKLTNVLTEAFESRKKYLGE